MDAPTWNELSAALDEIISVKATPPPLQQTIEAVSAEGIQGKDSVSLWARVLTAILGSPYVHFNRTVSLQLQFAGLTGIDAALNFAQKRRGEANLSAVDEQTDTSLQRVLEPLLHQSHNEVSMQQGHYVDIHNVQAVISAHFGKNGLTVSPIDVTGIVSKRLRDNTLYLSDLANHELHQESTWDKIRKAFNLSVPQLTIRYFSNLVSIIYV
jgi:hypothetical protein